MARINEYQRKQLASSVTDVAQPSKAGQMIGAAVTDLGTKVKRMEAESKRRKDVYDDILSDNAVLNWSMRLSKQEYALKNEYASNPSEYQNALLETGETFLTDAARGIKDQSVRDKFTTKASKVLLTNIKNSVNWTFAKQSENAYIALKDTLDKEVLETGKTTDIMGLEISASIINDTIFNTDKNNTLLNISHSDRIKLRDSYLTQAVSAHLSQMVVVDPYNLVKDLQSDKYNNITVQSDSGEVRIPVTDKLKKEYIKKATTRLTAIDEQKKTDLLLSANGQSGELVSQYFSGEINMADVLKEAARAELDPYAHKDYKQISNVLADIAIKNFPSAKVDNPSTVLPIHDQLNAISGELEKYKKFSKGVKGVTPKAKVTAAGITSDLLEIRLKALNAYQSGEMTVSTLKTIEKRVTNISRQGVLAQEQYGKKFWGGGYRDEYSEQYKKLASLINQRTDLNQDQKNQYLIATSNEFMGEILKLQDSLPGGELSPEMMKKASDIALARTLPKQYKIGDVVNGYKVIGYTSNNSVIIDVPPDLKAAVTKGKN